MKASLLTQIGQYSPMTVSDLDHLAQGEEALRSARWAEARDAFEESINESPTPEAMDGLGRALWWMGG